MAFISALVRGSADFTGSYAILHRNQFQALVLSALSGFALLAAAVLIIRNLLQNA